MAKKKIFKIIISIVIVLVIAVLGFLAYYFFGVVGVESKRTYRESDAVVQNVDTGKTVLDDTVTYQTMNGFGASACWWSQDIGKWENSEEILSYLYDSDKGIGLNIYRYNLGAGSKGDEHILTENRKTEGFLQADGTYDFSADKDAQSCLAIAKKLAGDDLRVTLFSNSPPVSLTKNGAGYGAPTKDSEAPLESNIDEANYDKFADFCYNSAEFFLNEGYRVTDVSPINEPQYSWQAWFNWDGSYSVNQEGCYYSETDAMKLYNAMINKFAGSELDEKGCKISMFESGAIEGENTTNSSYIDTLLGTNRENVFKNKPLRNYFDSISMHSYWSSAYTKEQAAKYLADKYSQYDIVCTEYCQMTNDQNTGVMDLIEAEKNGTNGLTIEYGVAMAKVIVDDLTILNAKEWDWWTACSYGIYPDGLVYLNPDNHKDIQTSKRLWCLGNFSKFIDEGATRIACSSGVKALSSCAFVNEDNSTVVVYVNNTDTDVTTMLNSNSAYSIYTTSDSLDLAQTASGEAGEINVLVPAMSVVTVVMK